jgi:hypothetical protein
MNGEGGLEKRTNGSNSYAAIRNSMVIFFHGAARDRPFLVTSPTS